MLDKLIAWPLGKKYSMLNGFLFAMTLASVVTLVYEVIRKLLN